jgi:hypothetical protein
MRRVLEGVDLLVFEVDVGLDEVLRFDALFPIGNKVADAVGTLAEFGVSI